MASLKISLRVDKSVAELKEFIDAREMGGFGVREVAGANEHWHFYLETDKYRNIQSFRVQLTKAILTLKGNGGYSATIVDDIEKYERYLCKGNSDGESPEIAWRNSIVYTDDKIGSLHEEYWKANRILKKRKTGAVIDWVVDECKRQNFDWKEREKISLVYVAEISRRAKPLNTFAAKAAVNGIQLQLCATDDAVKMFAEQL